MSGAGGRRNVVAAVGCEYRRDDGAGPAVLDRLRGQLEGTDVLGPLASPLDLLGAWDGAQLAVVVDAAGGAAEPGDLYVVEVEVAASPGASVVLGPRPSSHGFGVVEVLRLARVLGSAPERVVLVGVCGEDFGPGVGLSPRVSEAVGRAARLVAELVGSAAAGRS